MRSVRPNTTGQRDAYFDLLLEIRRQQPGEFEALDPALKIRALEYGARMKEAELIRDEEKAKH
ncbi:MAG: hypothetical protein H0W99_01810 [Acidobacteria bacterium]|jgi:hypothetical protein|nr:hypothetical protein [Acidobacteriota bacterium]